MSLIALLPYWRWILAALALMGIVGGLYWWSADIKAAAYDQFYAAQNVQALKEKQNEIDRLNRISTISQQALAAQAVKSKALQDQVNRLDASTRGMNLTGPVSPDLARTLEQINQLGRAHE